MIISFKNPIKDTYDILNNLVFSDSEPSITWKHTNFAIDWYLSEKEANLASQKELGYGGYYDGSILSDIPCGRNSHFDLLFQLYDDYATYYAVTRLLTTDK